MDLLDDDDYLYNPYANAGAGSGEEEADEDDEGEESEDDFQARGPASSNTASQAFSLHNSSWKAKQHGGARVKHVVAVGHILWVATDAGRVVRWHLGSGEEHDVVIDKGRNDVIFKLHVDPSGYHLIIGGNQGDNWYLPVARSLKPRILTMAKGARIESVCWDKEGSDDTSTGNILVGTSRGGIYKPFCGLQCEQFPPTGKGPSDGSRRLFVMAATPSRYYEFIGGPTHDALFQQYTTAPAFIELPGDLDYSELHFFRKANARASSFCWLTGPGIYSGSFSFGSQGAGDSIIFDYRLVPYLAQAAPLGIIATEFHWFVLFKDRLQVVSQLTEALAWEYVFQSRHIYGDMRGMVSDPASGRIWLYSDYMVNEVVVSGEDHDVWRCYLDRGQFDAALQHCRDLAQREKVLTAQADHFFAEGQSELAASVYAKTKRAFEEIALKFINLGEKDALKRYLSDKLDNMRASDRAQLTMACAWLCEMYLDKLNAVKESGGDDDYGHQLDEFKHFLQDNVSNLDAPTTYQLILHHGRMDLMLYYAELNGDHDRVVTHHVQRREWEKALECLSKAGDADLFYKHSPTLMQHVPVGTVDAWIEASRGGAHFDPRKLMPALARYDISSNPPGNSANQAVRFLSHCARNLRTRDSVLLNYLAALYCRAEDDAAILAFLSEQGGAAGRIDLQLVMRECKAANKPQPCCRILAWLGQYEQAVDLALSIRDVELARLIVEEAHGSDELRRRLWLSIARHVIEEERDVKRAIAMIGEADGQGLKVEDILPFFPDFALIDDFREAICSSLEDYHRHIEDLKRGMEEATRSAELIRKDMNELRGRFGIVRAQQLCEWCHTPVLSAGLYLFPCGHAFHIDCQERYMLRGHLSDAERTRVRKLKAALASGGDAGSGGGSRRGGADAGMREAQVPAERLQAELDELLGSECPQCGVLAIEMLAKPLPKYGDGPAAWALPPLKD